MKKKIWEREISEGKNHFQVSKEPSDEMETPSCSGKIQSSHKAKGIQPAHQDPLDTVRWVERWTLAGRHQWRFPKVIHERASAGCSQPKRPDQWNISRRGQQRRGHSPATTPTAFQGLHQAQEMGYSFSSPLRSPPMLKSTLHPSLPTRWPMHKLSRKLQVALREEGKEMPVRSVRKP